ncbi:hypothetical protein P692DRAFT_20823814, partial [Suillus brevipes Sb2]
MQSFPLALVLTCGLLLALALICSPPTRPGTFNTWSFPRLALARFLPFLIIPRLATSTPHPIFIYVQAINQVLRLLPISNEEVRYRQSVGTAIDSRFLALSWFVQSIRIHGWPEEWLALAHPPHDILRHVGFLHIVNDSTQYSIYEIESGGSAFLNACRTDICAANLHGGISPIWMLDQLAGVQFNPATYPYGFPPPASPTPAEITAWQTSLPQPSSSQAAFADTLFHQYLDFDYEPSIIEPTSVFDLLPAPTLLDDDNSVPDVMTLVSTQSSGEAESPHPDLPWRRTSRGDILDKGQKLLLKALLAASPWGRSIKLAKYLFIGHFLVGIPVNPFIIPEPVSRQLVTTSFLRALRFNEKTYDELSNEPLTITNDDGSETVVGWSYLRNR